MATKRDLPPKLHLLRGGTNLGTIAVKPGSADYPWYTGTFEPTPEFASVRELFELELALLQANESDDSAKWDEWEPPRRAARPRPQVARAGFVVPGRRDPHPPRRRRGMVAHRELIAPPTVGYPGTPLAKKLGIADGQSILVTEGPDGHNVEAVCHAREG